MLLNIILLGFAGAFAILALAFKRHVALPILTAMAGGIVAQQIAPELAVQLKGNGVVAENVMLDSVVATGLILIPAIVGLLVAPRSRLGLLNIPSVVVFGAVVVALVTPYLTGIFHEDVVAESQVNGLGEQASRWILVFGLVVALIDAMVSKLAKGKDHKK